MGTILAVNISQSKGVVKIPVDKAQLVVGFGIRGDAHGGDWHRQVSLLARESSDKVAAVLGKEIEFGRFAENLTTQGIELYTLPVGTRLRIGEKVLLEITQIGKECHNGCEIKRLTGDCVMPREGVFARVMMGGTVQAGDSINVEESDSPKA